jgi:hypothetical protein
MVGIRNRNVHSRNGSGNRICNDNHNHNRMVIAIEMVFVS